MIQNMFILIFFYIIIEMKAPHLKKNIKKPVVVDPTLCVLYRRHRSSW